MSEVKDGGPAFPVSTRPTDVCDGKPVYDTPYTCQDSPCTVTYGGMTLRDYFAATAVAAFGANVSFLRGCIKVTDSMGEDECKKRLATYAFEIADAMLLARAKQ